MKVNCFKIKNLKGIFLIFLIIFSQIFLQERAAAQTIPCGTPPVTDAQLQNLKNEWLAKITSGITEQIVIIPVAFHIILSSSGQYDVYNPQIYDQISVLNQAFSGTNFRFSLHSVDRTSNDSWTSIVIGSQETVNMRQSLKIDPAHVLNVYISRYIYLNGGLRLGYCFGFPWDNPESSYLHGVTVPYNTFPGGSQIDYNQGINLVHEVGHFLGLFHTFSESGSCTDAD